MAGAPGAGAAGAAAMGGSIDMTPDFTLPPLPDGSAADLSLTDENEHLFYRVAVNLLYQLMPGFHEGSLSRAGLLDGTPPEPSPDFPLVAECADQTITLENFMRTACGGYLGEYEVTSAPDALTLEYRTRQASGWTLRQAQRSEYALEGGILTASLTFGMNVVQFDSSPILWIRSVSHYEAPKDLYAGAAIAMADALFSDQPQVEIGVEVHVQSVQRSPIGYLYSSLTGFDGHFRLDLLRRNAAPLLYQITDHAGTTRCFFGQELPTMRYYLADEILTDRNCDGTSEATLVVTGD
jgi:hypothetical protein